MEKFKVLHLLPTNKFSGAENVVCQIIDLFKNDIEMVYCCPNGPIANSLKEKNITYIPLERFNEESLKKVINEYKPDIIHAHDIRATILASLYSSDCKIISHIHANHENMRKFNIKSFMYYIASKKASHIFWVSDSALNNYKFRNKVKRKSTVLKNVIDTSKIPLKINEDSNNYNFDIVYLGRITYQKNPKKLIDVLSLVHTAKNDLKVAIIGDGDLLTETKEYAFEKGLGKCIQFFGFMHNPYKILASSKILVMTSRYEGTPMCALEAQSLGLPIVSTPTDGLKDLIKDSYNGYLSNDNVELADDIISILTDKFLLEELSNNSKEKSAKYNNLELYKNSLLEIYEKTFNKN